MSEILNVLSIRRQVGGPRPKYSVISPSRNFRDISSRKDHSPDMNLILLRCCTHLILQFPSCKKLKCHLEETVILSCSFTWANKCNEYEHIQMWTQLIRLLKGRKSFKEIVQVFLKSGPLYGEIFIRGNLYTRRGSYRSKLGSKFSMLVISLCKVRNTVIRGFQKRKS